jgi:putative DNA methylase
VRGGEDAKLGLLGEHDRPAPLIDVLHRILWLIENQPRSLPRFLDEARPNGERLRVVAQTLAGAALKGGGPEQAVVVTTTPKEQSALGKLLANWKTLIETPLAPGGRAVQRTLFDTKGSS